MAAPEYVPQEPVQLVRNYTSPPWRSDPWLAERPGDLSEFQPRGAQFGTPGPDQGYIYVLARRFEGTLTLTEEEHERDALVGCSMVALKRASIFSRAPVIHDLRIALTIWGFLGPAPEKLVELRKPLFQEVAHPHHYSGQRRLADLVPEEVLRRTPAQIADAHRTDWRSLLALSTGS
jgi:hypothetical protein